jgi:hypothetical protein
MIALVAVFWLFVSIFGFIGVMRGWAKELLVTFSIILGLAFIAVVENLIPVLGPFLNSNPMLQYWVRTGIVVGMTIFGYQSPKFSRLAKSTEKRDRVQDLILGLLMGLISGFFVIGTIWSFAHSAGYPGMDSLVTQPPDNLAEKTQNILRFLPPLWLGKPPTIYVAVVLAFIFVIVVFI